jgi:hypothetical protein
MKHLKRYKLFENLESEIDLQELESILIDFNQMGLEELDIDIKSCSSMVIDWNLFNDDKTGGPKCLRAREIERYTKSISNNSLTIGFSTPGIEEYNISETSEAYEMLKGYLFDNYSLIPNYISFHNPLVFLYFEDFDKIRELKGELVKKGDTIQARKLIFGFYR